MCLNFKRLFPVVALAIGAGTAGTMPGAEAKKEPEPRPPAFFWPAPVASVRQAAAAAHLPVAPNWAEAGNRVAMAPGDGVTMLITLQDGAKQKQWLLALDAVPPARDGKVRTSNGTLTFAGYSFHFSGENAPLLARLIGPLQESDRDSEAATAPKVVQQRIDVSAAFLGLGIQDAPAVLKTMRAARDAHPLPENAPEELVRKRLEASGLKEPQLRAFAGTIVALLEFFQVTVRTPGLKDVAFAVIEIPWLSLLKGKPMFDLNMLPEDRAAAAPAWSIPGAGPMSVLPLLLKMNGKPIAVCQMAAVAPRPPLMVSAGIVGMVVASPSGKGPRMSVQVISSRQAKQP